MTRAVQESEQRSLDQLTEEWVEFIGLRFNPFAERLAELDEHLLEYAIEPVDGIVFRLQGPENAVVYVPACGGKTALALLIAHQIEANYGSPHKGIESELLFPIVWNMRSVVWAEGGAVYPYTIETYGGQIGYAAVDRLEAGGETINGLSRFGNIAGLLAEIKEKRGKTPVVVVDGVEWLIEGSGGDINEPWQILQAVAPLIEHPAVEEGELRLKLILPPEVEPLLEDDHPDFCGQALVEKVVWTPEKLSELIRTRIEAGFERAPASLSKLSDPSVPADTEMFLIEKLGSNPTPRDVILVIQEAIYRHVLDQGTDSKLQIRDFEAAIEHFKE